MKLKDGPFSSEPLTENGNLEIIKKYVEEFKEHCPKQNPDYTSEFERQQKCDKACRCTYDARKAITKVKGGNSYKNALQTIRINCGNEECGTVLDKVDSLEDNIETVEKNKK